MKCQYCGSDILEGTRICNVCGAALVNNDSTVYAGVNDGASNYNSNSGFYNSSQQNQSHGQSASQTNQQNQFYGQSASQTNQQNQFYGQSSAQTSRQDQFYGQSASQTNRQDDFFYGQSSSQNGQQGNNIGMPAAVGVNNSYNTSGGSGSYGVPASQRNNGYQGGLTKKQLIQYPAFSKERTNFTGAIIVGYLSTFITFAFAMFSQQYSMLVDVVLILGLTLGIQFKYSRVCSVILFVYSIINTIGGFISSGRFTGLLIVAGGYCAVRASFSFAKAWKEYQETGTIPSFISR